MYKELICSLCKNKFTRIKFKESKSGLYFCSRICKDEGQKIKNNLREVWPSHYDSKNAYRRMAFDYYKHECADCGYNEFEILEVHHLDKNRKNNSIENLKILCPNCHIKRHRL